MSIRFGEKLRYGAVPVIALGLCLMAASSRAEEPDPEAAKAAATDFEKVLKGTDGKVPCPGEASPTGKGPGLCMTPEQVKLAAGVIPFVPKARDALVQLVCDHGILDMCSGLKSIHKLLVPGACKRLADLSKRMDEMGRMAPAGSADPASLAKSGISLDQLHQLFVDSTTAVHERPGAMSTFYPEIDKKLGDLEKTILPVADKSLDDTVTQLANMPLDPSAGSDPGRWGPYLRQNMRVAVKPDCKSRKMDMQLVIPATPATNNRPMSFGPMRL